VKFVASNAIAMAMKLHRAYVALEESDSAPVYKAVDSYDRWFIADIPALVSKAFSFDGDRFSGKDEPDRVVQVSRETASYAREFLSPAITVWVTEHFDDFYVRGVDMAVQNGLIEGRTVQKHLDERDVNSIELQVRQELDVWKGHWVKHERQVERELVGVVLARGTVEQFQTRMIARDAHVVGFPYGNSRLSWHEHVRRMMTGRPKQVAAVAMQSRLV